MQSLDRHHRHGAATELQVHQIGQNLFLLVLPGPVLLQLRQLPLPGCEVHGGVGELQGVKVFQFASPSLREAASDLRLRQIRLFEDLQLH